jgi:hypothetical protein
MAIPTQSLKWLLRPNVGVTGAQWSDQSGSGVHWTQPDSQYQPTVEAFDNGNPAVSVALGQHYLYTGNALDGTNWEDAPGVTVMWTLEPKAPAQFSQFPLFFTRGGNDRRWFMEVGIYGFLGRNFGPSTFAGQQILTEDGQEWFRGFNNDVPIVAMMTIEKTSSTTGIQRLYINNILCASKEDTLPALGTGNWMLGTSVYGGAFFTGLIGICAGWNRVLTRSEREAAFQEAAAYSGATLLEFDDGPRFYCKGDSTTRFNNGAAIDSYPAKFKARILAEYGKNLLVLNFGNPGQQVSDMADDVTRIIGACDPDCRNVVPLLAGINDMLPQVGNKTAHQTYLAYKSRIDQLRAGGNHIVPVAFEEIPFNVAERTAFNDEIYAGFSDGSLDADYLVRMSQDPYIGGNDQNQPPWYIGDGIHPAAPGNGRIELNLYYTVALEFVRAGSGATLDEIEELLNGKIPLIVQQVIAGILADPTKPIAVNAQGAVTVSNLPTVPTASQNATQLLTTAIQGKTVAERLDLASARGQQVNPETLEFELLDDNRVVDSLQLTLNENGQVIKVGGS